VRRKISILSARENRVRASDGSWRRQERSEAKEFVADRHTYTSSLSESVMQVERKERKWIRSNAGMKVSGAERPTFSLLSRGIIPIAAPHSGSRPAQESRR
jgi:hypothetical protein